MRTVKTSSPRETINIAKKFARDLRPGQVILLQGNLGSGKTTFVKGLIEELTGAKAAVVTSPTFVLMNHYSGRIPVYHFDLYRLETQHELEAIGFDEFVNDPNSISCIEWPEKAAELIPPDALTVRLESIDNDDRMLHLPKVPLL